MGSGMGGCFLFLVSGFWFRASAAFPQWAQWFIRSERSAVLGFFKAQSQETRNNQSNSTFISTRRFLVRPAGVLLEATGRVAPNHSVVMRPLGARRASR